MERSDWMAAEETTQYLGIGKSKRRELGRWRRPHCCRILVGMQGLPHEELRAASAAAPPPSWWSPAPDGGGEVDALRTYASGPESQVNSIVRPNVELGCDITVDGARGEGAGEAVPGADERRAADPAPSRPRTGNPRRRHGLGHPAPGEQADGHRSRRRAAAIGTTASHRYRCSPRGRADTGGRTVRPQPVREAWSTGAEVAGARRGRRAVHPRARSR